MVQAVILTILTKLSNIFLLLKTYSEAGFGFNLYLKGFRVIGIDYHAWQIRQDPKTGSVSHFFRNSFFTHLKPPRADGFLHPSAHISALG